MNQKYHHFPIFHTQQGVVLIITLTMLVLITLLAVSGMRTSTMEERMAGNSRNSNLAFQQAETVLRFAENRLQAQAHALSISNATTNNIGGIPCIITLNTVDFTAQANWDNHACTYDSAADDTVNQPPNYFIEYLYAPPVTVLSGPSTRDCFYRITARGYGATVNSHATLQSTYQFSSCS